LRVSPASPAFDTAYAVRNGWPPNSAVEPTFTMVPGAPRRTMSATAACIRKNGPRRLTAMCWSKSSGVVSRSVPREVSPAALTRQSMRPKRSTTAATEACAAATSPTSAAMYVAPSWRANAAPTSRRRPVTTTVAPARTAARDARTDALRPATDQHDLLVQQPIAHALSMRS
jgi:hypothetical protein